MKLTRHNGRAGINDRFGSRVHVLDWALHDDESTPHIHERHVFDCEDKNGDVYPQQEKALETLGFELLDSEKKPGRFNNRKMVFDAACRTLLFDICKAHGLHLEEEPTYGGRAYLEKQDYIRMKQQEQIEELTLKLSDVDALIDEVADIVYDKAVETLTDEVIRQTARPSIQSRLAEKQKEISEKEAKRKQNRKQNMEL